MYCRSVVVHSGGQAHRAMDARKWTNLEVVEPTPSEGVKGCLGLRQDTNETVEGS